MSVCLKSFFFSKKNLQTDLRASSYLLSIFSKNIFNKTSCPNIFRASLSKLSDKHCYDLFCANVGIEREFSRLQSTKVLSLLDKNKDVNKETNVTSYYLITTELYNDLINFLQYCLRFNQDMIKLTDKERYLNYLKNLPIVTKQTMRVTGYLKKTTRMTCLEMKSMYI